MTSDGEAHVSPAERWDARYRSASGVGEPAALLHEVRSWLPDGGAMVDVGGGSGANARWFARRGFDVTVLDVSEVALERVGEWAAADGVVVECIRSDVEADGLPPGRRWNVALMHLFYDDGVLRSLPGALESGGVLVFAQPTAVNLERHPRPGRRFLLEPGEIVAIARDMSAAGEVDVLEVSEAWRTSGRHEARLVARRL